MFFGSPKSNTLELTPGSHRSERIQFEIPRLVGSHSVSISEDEETSSVKAAVATELGKLNRSLAWSESKVRADADVMREADTKRLQYISQ